MPVIPIFPYASPTDTPTRLCPLAISGIVSIISILPLKSSMLNLSDLSGFLSPRFSVKLANYTSPFRIFADYEIVYLESVCAALV